jgi:predicted MFS family arabinose efflux permease
MPAGRYAEGGDLKRLIGWGAALSAAGMLMLALLPGFWALLAGRAVGGLGQGLLLIGIQSYLLSVVPPDRRTQGAAVQVIGYNGALISGSAIGALLAVFVGVHMVFAIAAAIGGLALVYLWRLVPATVAAAPSDAAGMQAGLVAGVFQALADWRFSRALLLIGVVSKLVLSGVVMFAIPLVLARQAFAQEDIGQLLMLYAAATLVATFFAARLVDRLGDAKWTLAVGAVSAGLGMVLVGLVGAADGIEQAAAGLGAGWLVPLAQDVQAALAATGIGWLPTAVVVLGMLLIGVSHGLIAAPIITLVGDTEAAQRLGRNRATASYRFLERIGHVAGPLLVGHVLVLAHYNPIAISLFGVVSIVSALLFLPGRTAAGRSGVASAA